MERNGDSDSSGGQGKVRRQTPRVSVAAMVNLRRKGHHRFSVQVFDLSPEGCKVEFIERPQLDENLWLKFDGLESLEASVRWVASNAVGVQFLRPIHSAVFDLLISKMR